MRGGTDLYRLVSKQYNELDPPKLNPVQVEGHIIKEKDIKTKRRICKQNQLFNRTHLVFAHYSYILFSNKWLVCGRRCFFTVTSLSFANLCMPHIHELV